MDLLGSRQEHACERRERLGLGKYLGLWSQTERQSVESEGSGDRDTEGRLQEKERTWMRYS